jgi:hypothetical protein
MKEFNVSILEYLGKVDDGVLVLVSVIHESKYYEATFFYTEQDMIFTISEELEEVVGEIKSHREYPLILKDLIKRVVPFSEMIDKIDPVDFGRWVEGIYQEFADEEAEYINSSDIKEYENGEENTLD